MTAKASSPAGLLVIDKPSGFTSMDVCAVVRGKLRRAGAPKGVKVGHAGTLDPLATGVLVVLVGAATRLSDAIMAGRKRYDAEIDLSMRSNTDDAEGELTPVGVANPPTRAHVDSASAAFVGTIQQRPPAFSAISVGGRRAYQMARKGHDVDLPERAVTIHELRVVSYEFPKLAIDVTCGKGTYIRSLARDLGAALGAGGMLTRLRRTMVGRFMIDDARALASLPDALTQSDLLPIPESPAP